MTKTEKIEMKPPTKKVAIVVPMSNRADLQPDEQISIRHLEHYLGQYDKYLVVPESLAIEIPDFLLARFDDSFFGSVLANTRLMLSKQFYERFLDYEYILIYHLDALVFSDDLEKWCDAGWDYIGPPWLVCDDSPWVKEPGVGNGGFSLRNVRSFLKVLSSSRYSIHPDEYWQRKYADKSLPVRLVNLPKKYLKYLRQFNNVQREVSRFQRNEDLFWGTRAKTYYPEFKIASVEDALNFAFEAEPRQSIERTNGQMPFGCHAWPRYDRKFWEPHLLTA